MYHNYILHVICNLRVLDSRLVHSGPFIKPHLSQGLQLGQNLNANQTIDVVGYIWALFGSCIVTLITDAYVTKLSSDRIIWVM